MFSTQKRHLARGGLAVALVVVGAALPGVADTSRQVATASTSISLDEPFTGTTLNNPSKWISMRGGTHPEWPCLTAASTAVATSSGTVEACANQGGSTVAAGQGAMRLSRYRLPAQNWTSAGSLLYTDAFDASEGIDISFSIRLGTGDVADGMSFFLKNGANTTNTVGVAGGALGYGRFASISAAAGVPGAMLGVGFDRFGNFSSEQVASVGCAQRGTHPNTTPRNPQDKNMLVLRGPDTSGSQDGSAGYCYLRGQQVSFSSAEFQRVRVKVASYTPGSPTNVSVYLADVASPTLLPLTPTLTETMTFTATSFKFGFSASTGFWSNDHEIRGLSIRPAGPAVSALATAASTGSGTGPTSGGTTLTITGTNINPAATVTVDGQPCTNVTVNGGGTQLTCLTPAGSVGTKQVVITNPNGGPAFGSFTYVNPTPTVTAVSPAEGVPAGGNTVTVTGTGFVAGATVTFGGQTCSSVSVLSPTSLTCVVPAGTDGSTVDVVVTNVGPVSGTGAGLYAYRVASTTTTSIPLTTTTTVTPTATGSQSGAGTSTTTTTSRESPPVRPAALTERELPQTGGRPGRLAVMSLVLLLLAAVVFASRRRLTHL